MNSNSDRKIVWLCDLTHSFQTNAMNKMPLAIGMIASYCIKMLDGNISFQILKFLTELLDEIKNMSSSAKQAGNSGKILGKLFDSSIRIATDIRNSTGIGIGIKSIGDIAVNLAEEKVGNIGSKISNFTLAY